MELRTPRDRDGSFEPQLVKKNQTRIIGMNNQILALYARGMTTREITSVFKEMFGHASLGDPRRLRRLVSLASSLA
ncbi:transposase [Escherichia coli]|nr:transposase [Escherichia coli]GDA50672.1 transposase [Escherichia coli]GDB44907.1 transposase [Escherichia coli]GDC26896.1 transposase [Escherichia coli]